MKRLIRARKTSLAFGRGTIDFLCPRTQQVLAYVRRCRRDTLLIVNNLSGSSQPVELDLRAFAGSIPTEMLGGHALPGHPGGAVLPEPRALRLLLVPPGAPGGRGAGEGTVI